MLETGYYRKFKDEDAFVFSGTRLQVEDFRNLISDLSLPAEGTSFSTNFLFGSYAWEVSVFFVDAAEEISFFRIVNEESREAALDISKSAAQLIVDLIDGLIKSEKPGHIYFDGSEGSVLVIVSMDEI